MTALCEVEGHRLAGFGHIGAGSWNTEHATWWDASGQLHKAPVQLTATAGAVEPLFQFHPKNEANVRPLSEDYAESQTKGRPLFDY